MCLHCCNLKTKICPRIPYACPHCPVHTISQGCASCRRPVSEHQWYMKCQRQLYTDPNAVNTLALRWLSVNRYIIFTMARRLKRSPEAVQYFLLKLLHCNFAKLTNLVKRQNLELPFAAFYDCGAVSIFDEQGNLLHPMEPHTLGLLLCVLRDYLKCMQQLNAKHKWYNKGLNDGNWLDLLGDDDALVKLLRGLLDANKSNLFPTNVLLQELFRIGSLQSGRRYNKQTDWLKDISDLYGEVAGEEPNVKTYVADETSLNNLIYGNIEHPFYKLRNTNESKKKKHRQRRRTVKRFLVNSEHSVHKKAILAAPMPVLVMEPFDKNKPWTWMSRHPHQKRLTPTGEIKAGYLHHYRNMDEEQRYQNMRTRMSVGSLRSFDNVSIQSTFGRSSRPKYRPSDTTSTRGHRDSKVSYRSADGAMNR